MEFKKGDKIIVNFSGIEDVVEFNDYRPGGRHGDEFTFRDSDVGLIWLCLTKHIVGPYLYLHPLKKIKKVKL